MIMSPICFWEKRKKKHDEMKTKLKTSTGTKKFSYGELSRSTHGFAQTEKLGNADSGEVYKGFLADQGIYVAIKRVPVRSNQGIKEATPQLKIISRLRHNNLVQLIGWCHEKQELFLVYEFIGKGSLDLYLFARNNLLAWSTRYKIACGIASALLYLHDGWEESVLHRNIKSSNIMLDSNFNAKVGDFGFGKLVDREYNPLRTVVFTGTWGYMAPEYVLTDKASKKTDVFSFGIVVLEIVCGRRAVDSTAQRNKIQLVEWVSDLYRTGTILEAVDHRLGSDYDEEEMMRLMTIGLWCVQPKPEDRPSMGQVGMVIRYESPLPKLHSLMLSTRTNPDDD